MDPANVALMSGVVGAVAGAVSGAFAGMLVEPIKVWLSGRAWVGREKWKLKRDLYVNLLSALRELADIEDSEVLLDQQERFYEAEGKDAAQQTWKEHAVKRREELAERSAIAWRRFRRTRGAMPLLLTDATVEALRNLERDRHKDRFQQGVRGRAMGCVQQDPRRRQTRHSIGSPLAWLSLRSPTSSQASFGRPASSAILAGRSKRIDQEPAHYTSAQSTVILPRETSRLA